MDDKALAEAVEQVIAEAGASSIKDMGNVMGMLRGKFAGQMDFGKASAGEGAAGITGNLRGPSALFNKPTDFWFKIWLPSQSKRPCTSRSKGPRSHLCYRSIGVTAQKK